MTTSDYTQALAGNTQAAIRVIHAIRTANPILVLIFTRNDVQMAFNSMREAADLPMRALTDAEWEAIEEDYGWQRLLEDALSERGFEIIQDIIENALPGEVSSNEGAEYPDEEPTQDHINRHA